MSIFSDTFESDLDIVVWIEQVLEPACQFHEHAATCWDAAQQMTEIMSEQIALEMNAKIIERILDNYSPSSTILDKTQIQYEQKVLRRANGQGSNRNLRHPRAGPIRQ